MTTLPKPIGRLAFLCRLLLGNLAVVGLYVGFNRALWFASGRGQEPENGSVVLLFFGLWVVLLIFLIMCFVRFVIVARLVSIGVSRWLTFLVLSPYISFVFLLFLLCYPAKMEAKNDPVV
jgi:phosphoglycerol transferase MdoB-like AlkP superfamily enzyme